MGAWGLLEWKCASCKIQFARCKMRFFCHNWHKNHLNLAFKFTAYHKKYLPL